ncbi:hypothetical protein C0992_005024 [Termitomyces sp. T32_za158]|nr:hypothetical protein C0992_005024 [Termitomyces sp. T32_za158]
MSFLLSPSIEVFRWSLQPVPPFTWFGSPLSTLDVLGAVRLCLILRQLREQLRRQHVAKNGVNGVEKSSFVKSLAITLTVVFGGEAVTAPMLGIMPSYMISGAVVGLFGFIQAVIDALPVVPDITAELELPLSILDGFTRAFLLCNLIPPAVTMHASSVVSESPWSLLITSLLMANSGFFFVNLFSMLAPTPFSLTTPAELRANGWTTADLWCAPAITGLYALLTHAQPFWADVHALIMTLLGGATSAKTVEPVDPETARAVCALLLSGLFLGRAVKNFGLWKPFSRAQPKIESTFDSLVVKYQDLIIFFCATEMKKQ